MAIINLKNISFTDSDNIKLDKVNYNFDQLVSNGGGPQGPTGSHGVTGPQGVNGYQGPFGVRGDQGDQGPIGSAGTQVWIYQEGDTDTLDANTVFPKHDDPTDPTGDGTLNPPVVSVGFRSDSPMYGVTQEDTGQNVPYQFIINRNDNYALSNLALRTDGTDNLFLQSINWDDQNNTSIMKMSFSEVEDNRIEYWANKHTYIDNITGANLLEISSNGIVSNVGAEFNEELKINGDLIVSTGITPGDPGSPDVDKIAVSADAQGTIIFKYADELGGTAPIGTIISMLPSIYNDNTKFIQQETVNPNGLPIEIRVGSGIGDYEGWYVCNGQTWTDGVEEYEVPGLNSFSYSIEDDPSNDLNSQGSAVETNNNLEVIGGADISTAALFSSPNYTITSSVTDSDINLDPQGFQGATTVVKVKRLPQIIYLGVDNLYWQDAGSDQAPLVDNTYTFAITSDGQPGTILSQYTDTISVQSGTTSSELFQLPAPDGYRWTSEPTVSYFFDTSSGIPSIVSGPPPLINGTDDTLLDIYINQLADGSSQTFYYLYPASYIEIINIDNTYIINDYSEDWTSTPGSITINENPGDNVTVGTFDLEAPSFKYFDSSKEPLVQTASRVSLGTMGLSTFRNGDIGISSYEYQDAAGIPTTTKPVKLQLNITDNDFADTSAVSGGTTEDTTIKINGIAFFDRAPYIEYSTSWTGGNNTWNATNFGEYSTSANRNWNIKNNTEDQVVIRLKVSKYNTNGDTTAEITINTAQVGSTNTILMASTGIANTIGLTTTSATAYSGTTYTIPAGATINIEWTNLQKPSSGGWFASIEYYSGSTPTTAGTGIQLQARPV